MKSSEILTRAAEFVDSGKYQTPYFAVVFGVDADGQKAITLFDSILDFHGYKNVQHRVMALLMCAAIAESEGD